MQRPGCRHIEQARMSVIHGIFLPRGIQNQYCVKFQALCVFYGKHHDTASKFCLFQVLLQIFKAVFQRNMLPQSFCRPKRTISVPTDDRNGGKAPFLPVPADFGGPSPKLFGFGKGHFHRISMTYNRLHRISDKTSMMQNICGKFRDFHRIAVALFQNAKAVHFI